MSVMRVQGENADERVAGLVRAAQRQNRALRLAREWQVQEEAAGRWGGNPFATAWVENHEAVKELVLALNAIGEPVEGEM